MIKSGVQTNNYPRFIWSSSLDRGIDTLLYLWQFIRKEFPDATLDVYYGMENWSKAIDQRNNEQEKRWKNQILIDMKQPGINYHGRVGQDKIAKAFLESDIWFYPSKFTETFCITALEAQISKTVVVCSDLAALQSTVGERGILIQGDAYTKEYREKALQEVFSILKDDKRRKEMTDKAYEWAKQQTWDIRAKEMLQVFERRKDKMNNNELRNWDVGDNARCIDKFWRESSFEIALHQQVANLIVSTLGRQAEVFEVGCGSGMVYEYLRGRVNYRCGDVSESFRILTRERYPELDPMYVDIYQLPFGNVELPNVINIDVLQHLPHYEKPIQELIRVAKKRVIIVTWCKENCEDLTTDGVFHNNYYDISSLVKFCKIQPDVEEVNYFALQDPRYCICIEKKQ